MATNKTNGKNGTPNIQQLTKDERDARAAFNDLGEGWDPKTAEGKAVRAALREARKALKVATQTTTAREAYVAAGHTPTYRARGKAKVAVEA